MARGRSPTPVSLQCMLLALLVLAAIGNVWYLSAASGCTSTVKVQEDTIRSLTTEVQSLKSQANSVAQLPVSSKPGAPKTPTVWDTPDVPPVTAPKPAIRGAAKATPAAVDMSSFTVLVICYNRPQYLQRTLRSIGAAWPSTGTGPNVLISQDGTDASVAEVARGGAQTIKDAWMGGRSGALTYGHVQHPQSRKPGDDPSGYFALARHFGWAITRAFETPSTQFVIIVEDDLELAQDFFGYFSAVAPTLASDPTLLAASAYNDIGQPKFVGDAGRVVRSDFFPGLGWMLTRARWEELGPKWPKGYWDDWLREPAQRLGRNILRPEVSRSRTFGEKGVSRAQFFHKYLGTIHLNTAPAEWAQADLQYLEKGQWDLDLAAVVAGATPAASSAALKAQQCGAGDQSALSDPVVFPGHHDWLPPGLSTADMAATVHKFEYSGFQGAAGYERVAQVFGFIGDVKARVPRTAYRGVVSFRHQGCLKLLVPTGWTPSFESK